MGVVPSDTKFLVVSSSPEKARNIIDEGEMISPARAKKLHVIGVPSGNMTAIRNSGVRAAIVSAKIRKIPTILMGTAALQAYWNRRDVNTTDNAGYLEPYVYATYDPEACKQDTEYFRQACYVFGDADLNVRPTFYDPTLDMVHVTQLADFPYWVGGPVVFDIETTGFIRGKDKFTVGCFYFVHLHKIFVVTDVQLLHEIWRTRGTPRHIIGHNIKFDLTFEKWNIDFKNPLFRIDDTNIMTRISTSQRCHSYKLTRLVQDVFHYGKWWFYDGVLDKMRDQEKNCAIDCYYTYKLYEWNKQTNVQAKPYEISTDALRMFCDIEKKGIQLERKALQDLVAEYHNKLKQSEDNILKQVLKDGKLPEIKKHITDTLSKDSVKKLSGRGIGNYVNMNSPKQVSQLLYDIYQLPLKSKDYWLKERKVDNYALTVLGEKYPIAKAIHEYTKNATAYGLVSSLLHEFSVPDTKTPQLCTIYPQHNPEGAATGRTSSSKPNIQQQKLKDLTKTIYVPDGWALVGYDLSQIELRILAYITQDPVMLQSYLLGEDLHNATVKSIKQLGVTIERREAKVLNFGTVYGISATGARDQMREQGIKRSRYEVEQALKAKYQEWPKVGERMFNLQHDTSPYIVSPIGRKRLLTEVDPKRQYRQKLNTPVQSMANDVSLKGAYWVWKLTDPMYCKILAFIHDAILALVKLTYMKTFLGIVHDVYSNKLLDHLLPENDFNVPIFGELKVLKLKRKPWGCKNERKVARY